MAGTLTERRWAFDAPGGFLPWLTSLRRDLRHLVANTTATKEERELLLLLDYAASHHGDVLLAADDVDDLDDRLDDLLRRPDVFHWHVLAARLARPLLRREPVRADRFAETAGPAIGAGQVRALEAAAPLIDAYFRVQRELLARFAAEDADDAWNELEAVGPQILTSPDVPPEVAASLAGGLRAGLSMLGIARAVQQGTVVEPWLARELVERLVSGIRAHLRLLAAMPGAEVPESVLPVTERLDLAAIGERHRRARRYAERTFGAARSRLLRDA